MKRKDGKYTSGRENEYENRNGWKKTLRKGKRTRIRAVRGRKKEREREREREKEKYSYYERKGKKVRTWLQQTCTIL